MRAAVLRDGVMRVRGDVPEPTPGAGQVLVGVEACGICGTDLHFATHGHEVQAIGARLRGLGDRAGGPAVDFTRDVFMGHEFVARVLEAGPDTPAPPAGTLVTSMPIMPTSAGIEQLASSNTYVGGFAERMLLPAALLVEVPVGLDPREAALTEPLAVGLHAVNRSGIAAGTGALVLGSGPVGLAMIAALKLRGIEPIVASDLSPARRRLALTMGADDVVDPRSEPAFDAWTRVAGSTPVVAFDAIGVPGIIDEALCMAPPRTRIVVAGVCMSPDTITPYFGIAKELELVFSRGYDADEFASCLRSIADGAVDVTPLITGEVGLDSIADAFEDLRDPEAHCKILVLP